MADLKIATRKSDSMGISPVYLRKGLIARFARRLYQHKRLRIRLLFDLGYGVYEGFIHPYTKHPIGELPVGKPIGTVIAKNEDGSITVRMGEEGKAE